MIATDPDVGAELAAAMRRVAAAYEALSADRRPGVRWDAEDDALERALKTRDRASALAAIRAWERRWQGIFEEVGE